MPLTAQLGTANSKLANVEPGLGATITPAAFTITTPPTLVVEMAFANDPIELTGYFLVDLADGPAAYWRMDNATSVFDQAGSGNVLTVEGTPTLVTTLVSGDPNQATSFNGTSQDAYALSSPDLSPTGPMSLEIWLQTPASLPASTLDVISKRGSYVLQLTAAGKLIFTAKNGAAVGTVTSASTLATSTTYHVACVYDGTNVRLYLNGVQDASVAYTGGVAASSAPVDIARTRSVTAAPVYQSGVKSAPFQPASLVVAKPTGTVSGDFLVTCVQLVGRTPTTLPSGWTLLSTVVGTTRTQYVYTKVAGGSEPSSYTWGLSSDPGNDYQHIIIARITGVNTTVPVGVIVHPAESTGTSYVATGYPDFDNSLLVWFFEQCNSGITNATLQLDTGDLQLATKSLAVAASNAATGSSTGSFEHNATILSLTGTGDSYLACSIDEVSVWGFALTATQVAAHYAARTVAPPTITWTDISADVRSVSTKRGRQHELDQIETGEATVVLQDISRAYDPANTLSPYAPNVLPMRQIRIRANLGGTYYPIFRGFVERWPSQWEGPNYDQLTLTCSDGFEPLSLAIVSGTVPASQSGATIANLLSKILWPGLNRQLDAGAFNLPAITLAANSVKSYVQTIAQEENGVFFINGAGVAVFHDKTHRSTNPLSTTSQGTFGDAAAVLAEGDYPYVNLVPSFDKDHIVNDWQLTDNTSAVQAASDTPSIHRYFRRSATLSTYLAPADATTMAAVLLAKTKDPGYRFDSIDIKPITNLGLWQQALGREIGDRITVKRQPVAITPGSQIVQDCWIEKIEWVITPSGPWTVTWQLSPAS